MYIYVYVYVYITPRAGGPPDLRRAPSSCIILLYYRVAPPSCMKYSVITLYHRPVSSPSCIIIVHHHLDSSCIIVHRHLVSSPCFITYIVLYDHHHHHRVSPSCEFFVCPAQCSRCGQAFGDSPEQHLLLIFFILSVS